MKTYCWMNIANDISYQYLTEHVCYSVNTVNALTNFKSYSTKFSLLFVKDSHMLFTSY